MSHPQTHGAAVSTRNHSACCWSKVAPPTAVCIVIRSRGASNTSFVALRPSLCVCRTTCMEQSIWVRHWNVSSSVVKHCDHRKLFDRDVEVTWCDLINIHRRRRNRALHGAWRKWGVAADKWPSSAVREACVATRPRS